ncbi:META domain-containing protein [Sphingosinithalassobacter portus]|uniref:META domain-containing protein n=1 Tax=Stakelama portus TaxID=2676234 RepID=UPI0013795FB7|nr:META domain-containing protein [Sphingosinithalassobacter portus]
MPRPSLIAVSFVALIAAGCATTPSGTAQTPDTVPADTAASYHALGTEPFWSLTMDHKTIRFERPDHAPVVRDRPAPLIAPGGEVFRTPGLMVMVYSGRTCSDGMSDRPYPDTVRVIAERVRYEGCGGAPIDAETAADATAILDGKWQIIALAGQPIDDERATMEFREGRIAASAGCNRMAGSFRFAEDRLVTGALVSTRMACPGPLMGRENTLSTLLGQPLTHRMNAAEQLILTAPDGRTIVLRPIAPAPRPMR